MTCSLQGVQINVDAIQGETVFPEDDFKLISVAGKIPELEPVIPGGSGGAAENLDEAVHIIRGQRDSREGRPRCRLPWKNSGL